MLIILMSVQGGVLRMFSLFMTLLPFTKIYNRVHPIAISSVGGPWCGGIHTLVVRFPSGLLTFLSFHSSMKLKTNNKQLPFSIAVLLFSITFIPSI
jgi:hypothetical protein